MYISSESLETMSATMNENITMATISAVEPSTEIDLDAFDEEIQFFCRLQAEKLQKAENNNDETPIIDFSTWENEQVVNWLCSLDEEYEQYRDLFEQLGWSGEELRTITKKTLLTIGISAEYRDHILMSIKNLISPLELNARVRVKYQDEEWQVGKITSVDPLEVTLDGAEYAYVFDQICTFTERMNETNQIMHGSMGNDEWHNPLIAVHCDVKAREKYTDILAHEYEEDPRTLQEKVKLLANLIRNSTSACIYSGAGLSTSAGIADYASRAENSQIYKNRKKLRSNKRALPTLGHRVFASLALEGYLQHWVQQNHDGLPQKAGFPQHLINEVHGSWFDPSNTVVPMSGTLRSDLYDWMETIAEENDLCIAVGTSLSGMSADETFSVPCEKYHEGRVGFGGVIISIQRTPYDEQCSLRIYSKIDEVVALLAKEMQLTDIMPAKTGYKLKIPKDKRIGKERFLVPYDSDGNLTDDPSQMIIWDLRKGQKVRPTMGKGAEAGFEGTITARYGEHFVCSLPCQYQKKDRFGKSMKGYTLGAWWVDTAVKGLWPKLPVVNCEPKLQCERKQKKKKKNATTTTTTAQETTQETNVTVA